jgi:hypothetical protein
MNHVIVWADVEHNLDNDTHVLNRDKWKRVKWAAKVHALRTARACTFAELRSLIGKLRFAAESQQAFWTGPGHGPRVPRPPGRGPGGRRGLGQDARHPV